jgi:polyhydroxyalkanoate synthesis regulator protein
MGKEEGTRNLTCLKLKVSFFINQSFSFLGQALQGLEPSYLGMIIALFMIIIYASTLTLHQTLLGQLISGT